MCGACKKRSTLRLFESKAQSTSVGIPEISIIEINRKNRSSAIYPIGNTCPIVCIPARTVFNLGGLELTRKWCQKNDSESVLL